jgi:Domain of unknown function (DUF5615)
MKSTLMLRFAADENFNNDIVRAVRRIRPDIDIVRIQDIGLAGKDDPSILQWAAEEKRILLTHDVTTITKYAYQRINKDQYIPGVFEIHSDQPIKKIVNDIILIFDCSLENEWDGQVRYLPLT